MPQSGFPAALGLRGERSVVQPGAGWGAGGTPAPNPPAVRGGPGSLSPPHPAEETSPVRSGRGYRGVPAALPITAALPAPRGPGAAPPGRVHPPVPPLRPSSPGKSGGPSPQPAAAPGPRPPAGAGRGDLPLHPRARSSLWAPSPPPPARGALGPLLPGPKLGAVLFVCIVGRESRSSPVPSPRSPRCRAGPASTPRSASPASLPGEGATWSFVGEMDGGALKLHPDPDVGIAVCALASSHRTDLGGMLRAVLCVFPSWGEGIACSQAFFLLKIWVSSSPPPPLPPSAPFWCKRCPADVGVGKLEDAPQQKLQMIQGKV